jgi:hypothetical protein
MAEIQDTLALVIRSALLKVSDHIDRPDECPVRYVREGMTAVPDRKVLNIFMTDKKKYRVTIDPINSRY